MSHKIIETLTYTEHVYYDDDGNEVERVRRHDDALHDTSGPLDLTDDERDLYSPALTG